MRLEEVEVAEGEVPGRCVRVEGRPLTERLSDEAKLRVRRSEAGAGESPPLRPRGGREDVQRVRPSPALLQRTADESARRRAILGRRDEVGDEPRRDAVLEGV